MILAPSRYLKSALLVLLFAMIGWRPAFAQDNTFSLPSIERDAQRYEAVVRTALIAGSKELPRTIKIAAQKVLAGGADPRGAAKSFAQAAAADPKDAEAWQGLARALLAIPADSLQGAERYDMPLNASGAAYLAYKRAVTPAAKASALVTLGDALKRRSLWRPAIEAYRVSLTLVEAADVRAAFEKLRSEHGFRITEYKTENEAATPRLCIQFSERLNTRTSEPAKFVTVDGRDPQNVQADGQQLCIDGLVHGKRYEVKVRSGLPAETGDTLTKTAELGIYVKDRSASVRFGGKNYVLPTRGQQGLPVVTVNTGRIAIDIYRVGDRSLGTLIANGDFQRQMAGYDIEQLRDRLGAKVYSGEMDVASKLNEEVTSAIPIGDAVPELKPGAYALVAKPMQKQSDDNQVATQWFVVSDLGLTAFSGETGIHGFVRSLATAEAVAGAKVRLVARNNEVLGEAKSDANGYVRFPAGLQKGEGGLAPAILVAEGPNGGDYAFLDLQSSAFDLSDRGVKGREAPGPIDGYLYSDRGVYRPGETVNLAAIVRDRAGLASPVPMTLIVSRPDGVEHRRISLVDQGLGGRSHALLLAGSSMTGTWRAKLYADPKADPVASSAFLVEDFVPERLDLKLEAAAPALKVDEDGQLNVVAKYLYGPPAADLALEGDIVVKPSTKDIEGFAGYRFGLADEKLAPVRKPLEGLPRTDKDGRARIPVTLPAIPRTSRPLEADLLIKLREPGGRTIERTLTLPVSSSQPRLGIKPLFAEGKIGEGETAEFETVLIDATGKRLGGKPLAWTLSRLDQSWQWYSRDGQWAYEAVTLTKKIANGSVELGADAPTRIAAKVEYGRYRLDVASTENGGPASSVMFSAGWYTEESIESPEQLEVALDRPTYKAGETAKLRIASRTAGKALVTVLGDGIFRQQMVDVPKGGADVAVEVAAEFGPGAYVTAILYRPMDEAAKRMPSRAIGVRWLGLDQSARVLTVELGAPQKVKSGSRLDVPVKLAGLAAGEEARITVAAVDVGIVNLTRFQSPDPAKWFHQQRRLSTEIRDYYGRLIDGMRAERGRLRSGGDGGADGMTMNGAPPPVEAIVSLYSGIVSVGTDGTAKVSFDLPDFNGSVRLMAVAWTRDKLGHGTQDVIVRDPVALLASGPRFLTYGDEARIEIDLHNVELARADMKLVVEQEVASGGRMQVVARDIALDTNQRKQERFVVKPTELGLVSYTVRANGPDGLELKRKLTFDVKPPAADIKRTTVSQLSPKGGKLTIGRDLLTDLIPGRTRISMSVGPAATMDVPSLLTQLDRYPYGCAEQTISRALPLLSYNTLAVQVGLKTDVELKDRVQKAIERVLEMQDGSGAFGVWGPRNADLWLTSYVTDFLTRAKEAGYTVQPQALSQALDRLQNFISYAQDFEKGGEARAYALYVLARAGRAPIGDLRYYADTRLERFSTPLAQAQIGAALSLLGDKDRAEKAFRVALASLEKADPEAAYRADYGSSLRDGAALVALAAETKLVRDDQPRLARVLARAFQGRAYTSTQEQAWLLLAAKALSDQAAETRLTVGTAKHEGPLVRMLQPAELTEAGLAIVNDGDAAIGAVVSVIGAALTPEPSISKGLKIERSYYTLDGKKIDLKSATGGQSKVTQTDRMVVVLKVEPPAEGGRLLLVDRLPAGLEIENPRLVDSGDLKSLDWLKSSIKPEHTEFRDDRLVAAFNIRPGGSKAQPNEGIEASADDDEEGDTSAEQPNAGRGVAVPAKPAVPTAMVAYIVRAVTPGSFVHPAATVEDMYRPERFARTAAGKLDVVQK